MFIKKMIPAACLTAVLGFGLPSIAQAQITDAVKKTGQAAGQTVEKGAKKVGEAAKTTGTATKNAVTGRPQGTTGLCKDGTYTKAKTHTGACSKHGGVEKWF
jgi:Protein of unknown function (DUF3761)